MRERYEIWGDMGSDYDNHLLLEVLLDIRDLLTPAALQRGLDAERREEEQKHKRKFDLGILSETLEKEFLSAHCEDFRDGFESNFSRRLTAIIHAFGAEALMRIANRIQRQVGGVTVGNEALKTIGRVLGDDGIIPETKDYAREICEFYLVHDSHWLRSGAETAISFLNDPRSIPAVEKAVETEKSEMLKMSMGKLLEQLKEKKLEEQGGGQ